MERRKKGGPEVTWQDPAEEVPESKGWEQKDREQYEGGCLSWVV